MNLSRTRVKMCGMTRAEDIAHACSLGVDAVGLIFYSKSTRYVNIEQAQALAAHVPPFVDLVAVLVNPDVDFVRELIKKVSVQWLQFHGDESPNFCCQFDKPFIKAIHPQSDAQIHSAENAFSGAKALLFDTPSASHRGGSGLSFDWSIIPNQTEKPFILAGGLNEFNVAEAVKMTHPFAVDVCSGVEAMPGVKDHIKMSRFIKALWGSK